ncbi:MAG TPA: carboxypeptidase regulatory-like domain-containing protein [Bryobacteraceae bacterium]|nr:carboxypeptidase regulatory-like domain-containing protein [Bryobacteraceae bacterium]
MRKRLTQPEEEDMRTIPIWIIGLALVLQGSLQAQINTGTIVGLVTDPQGLIIAKANVSLQNALTGEVRHTVSNETGAFSLPGLEPGVYTLRIESKGFQKYQKLNLTLTAGDRLSAGTIALAVGSTTEAVTVSAEGAAVETASSENSGVLDSSQLNRLMVRGRDVISLLKLMPGVNQSSDIESLANVYGSPTPTINGLRSNFNTVSVDGQISNDADATNTHVSAVSMESIAEVKVNLNNYQAEYGRAPGAQISIITKSGTRSFHGSASWFVRNEAFNANNFFNNRNAVVRPLYRYNDVSETIGGPIYIPGHFNTDKTKLFFFYGRDDWRSQQPQGLKYSTMPTALERQGNFSQTLDLNGKLIPITDPTTKAPFPGNVIPSSQINQYGQAILNLYPLPNNLDRSITGGSYNYQFQDNWDQPKFMNQLRLDYNMTAKDRVWFRYHNWNADTRGYSAPATFGNAFPLLPYHYNYVEDSIAFNYTRIMSTSMVNEFTGTGRMLGELGTTGSDFPLNSVLRSDTGLAGLGQLYPAANPLGIIPGSTFGGVSNAPSINYDHRFPINAGDRRWSLADNLTWTQGAHIVKMGFYFERNYSNEGYQGSGRGSFGGAFNFGVDRNNPLDSNYAYSNAILGNFDSYSESSARNKDVGINYDAAWFVQDSWKATRRLTVDIGLRISVDQPWQLMKNERAASWSLETYNPANAPQLYQPALSDGKRVAQNPVTGEFAPTVLIGALVPGTGNPFNGMVAFNVPGFSSGNYPNGWRTMPGPQLQPRFGFAYDPFGDGKTAIRGSFAVTKESIFNSGYIFGDTVTSPPVVLIPTMYYQNMDSYLDATGYLFPPSFVPAWEKDYKPSSAYNYTFQIQRSIGFSTVVTAGYVGNTARHLLEVRNLNTLPYGARFLPQNQDATNPGRPLPDSLLAPIPGYGTVSLAENSGSSNYNALEVTANRRFAKGFQFGVSWTWSKAMDLTDSVGSLPMFNNARTWLYGKAGYDQTQVLSLSYMWDLPKASKILPNAVTRFALDNWDLAGITTFASGSPLGISYSTTDNADITGGGDGARINVTGNANLPSGDRSFYKWFNTSVFARPAVGDRGNAPRDVIRGPGINNWDLSLFKSFPIWSEARTLQLRCEMYNAFNHTQYSGVNTAARFDPAGNQVNSQLGEITSTRNPRTLQLALTFRF